MAKALDLRQQMPFTHSVIEGLREAFGRSDINGIIRQGMSGAPGFYARESGIEIGTPFPPARVEVSGEQMVIIVEKQKEPAKSRTKYR